MDILSKFKSTIFPSITDDQYREKVAGNATAILDKLLDSFPESFYQLASINILVIGAGFFPSFKPLCDILSRQLPNLINLDFTLIEPIKSETDRFNSYFSALNQTSNKLHIHCSTYHTDIKHFLLNNQDTHFDIIYFEQPDLSPAGILLAKTNNRQKNLSQSLRESVPYLKYIIRPHSIIIASCLFKRDLLQLNTLINFSLNIPTRLAYLPGIFMDGSPYHSGLISVIESEKLPVKNPEYISRSIKQNDDFYLLFFAASFILFLLTPPTGKILSLFFTIILIFYHRYGMWSIINKMLIITIQIFIIIAIYNLPQL